jgi:hypothetical protein
MLSAVWVRLSMLLLIMLNPDVERWDFMPIFFSASHLVLAAWMGYGLVMLGSLLARPHSAMRPKIGA